MRRAGMLTNVRTALLFHYAIILAACLPGAMVTVVASVYLVTSINIDPFIVGCYLNGSTIAGMVLTHYMGKSQLDKSNPVTTAIICLGMGLASVLLLLFVEHSIWFLIPAAACRAVAHLLVPVMFVFDGQHRPATGEAETGMYSTRLMISIVWIIGPPLAFYIYWLGEFGLIAAATACLSILSAGAIFAVAFAATPNEPQISSKSKDKENATETIERQLLVSAPMIFAIMVCVTGANVVHAIALPLYLLDELQVATYWPGWNMAMAATVEVVIIFFIPRMLKWTSEETLLSAGLALGLAYFILFSLTESEVVILVLQVMYGAHFALSTVVCLGMLRRFAAQKIGPVASKFVNAGKLGGLLGTTLFALFAARLGFESLIIQFCTGLIVTAFIIVIFELVRKKSEASA